MATTRSQNLRAQKTDKNDNTEDLLEDKEGEPIMKEGEKGEPTMKDLLLMLSKIDAKLEFLAKSQSSVESKLSFIEDKLLKQGNDISQLEKSVSFNADETSELKSSVEAYELSIARHEEALATMKDEINNMERYSRKFNLRFIGVAEHVNDKLEDCSLLIRNHIKSVLDINVDIENAHRTGKKHPGKPRHIIAKFIRRPERFAVFSQRGKFKVKGISVTEDLSYNDLQIRRKLSPYAKEAFDAGKKVRYRGTTLFINDVEFKLPEND